MQITFGNTTLCHGDARSNPGDAIGPANLIVSDSPGVVTHEFIGADRVSGEHVRCDRGTVQFSVSRTFGSIDAALNYFTTGYLNDPKEGVLKFGNIELFGGNKAVMTNHQLSMVGVTVVVNYTFEG